MVVEASHPGATDEVPTMAETTQEGGEDSQDQVEDHAPEDYPVDL